MSANVFDCEKILTQIRDFRLTDFRGAHYEDIYKKLEGIIWLFNLITMRIDAVPVFRVRKIDTGTQHTRLEDYFNPKPALVKKPGRANHVGESVFYGAFDPITAIRETRLQPGDQFSLSAFTYNSEPNRQSSIVLGIPDDAPAQNREMKLAAMILSDFIYTEFTRIVPDGHEHMYMPSAAIARLLFEAPHKDSLIYASMFERSKFNIAVKNDAVSSRLQFKNAFSCTLHEIGPDYVIASNHAEVHPTGPDGQIAIHPVEGRDNFRLTLDKFFKGGNMQDNFHEMLRKYTGGSMCPSSQVGDTHKAKPAEAAPGFPGGV